MSDGMVCCAKHNCEVGAFKRKSTIKWKGVLDDTVTCSSQRITGADQINCVRVLICTCGTRIYLVGIDKEPGCACSILFVLPHL